MSNIFQKFLLLIIGMHSCLDAFEVNTHQALTRCAITSNCNNGYAKNLYDFVNHGEIRNQSYGDEQFENYSKTYRQYANDGLGFEDWNIKVDSDYIGMIEAGSVLEDAVYPQHDNDGDGRFNNHFYAAQFDSKRKCTGFISGLFGLKAYMRTPHALCYGYGARTDNIDWVFNDSLALYWKGKRTNDYGLGDALVYYKKSFAGSAADRRKYQAKLFVSLGHIVHMLQDLHSPAHCRDNSHAKGDYLEIYGRYNGGFNLRGGAFNSANNHNIVSAIQTNGKGDSLVKLNRYATYEDFFRKELTWVGYNFASESHLGFEKIKTTTGAGVSVDNFFDSSSLFDGKNIHPSKSETYESGNISGLHNWAYIYTEGNVVSNSVKGYISPSYRKISLVKHGLLFDDYHMVAPYYTWVSGGVELKVTSLNQKPLEDTAVNVMPRAVASTQAFINFFFRGQIDVSIDKNARFTIKNVSNGNTLSDNALATFKKGGKFYLYYRSGSTNKFFSAWTLTNDLLVNYTTYLNLDKKIFKNIRQGAKITVLFDGYIGDNMNGYDSYSVGTRGLSVDVVDLPYIEQDPEPSPEPSPEPQPPNATYKYIVTTVDHTKPLPYRHGEYGQISFDVDIYRNNVLQRTDRLRDLLNVSWWNGGAHFGDTQKHHFDIWCVGYYNLCNFLTNRVPTDINAPYEDYNIDWTIWNYGLEEFSISLFLSNIRTQIGNYYAMTRTRKRSVPLKTDLYRNKDKEYIIKRGDKIQYQGDAQSDVQLRTLDGNTIDLDDNHTEDKNMTQQSINDNREMGDNLENNGEVSDTQSIQSGMTEEEKKEIDKIKEEESRLDE